MSVCPRCAQATPDGARFCPACGGRLAAPDPGRFASPGAYTPPRILTLLARFGPLARLPARLVGVGVRAEHIETPERAPAQI